MGGRVEKITLGTEKHSGDVTCLTFHENHLLSGGADGKIKVWSPDLKLIKDIDAHEAYVYAMSVMHSNGRLYSSSADGTIKYFDNPLQSNASKELMKTEYDEIISLCCVNDILYSGDDKGIVTKWVNNKIQFKYNLVEDVKSLAIEKNLIYTAKDQDFVVSEISSRSTSGAYSTKFIAPGRAPLLLFGPSINENNKSYIVFTTRDGKGLTLIRNLGKFQELWTKQDAHELIINCLCATDSILYSSGYDSKVKKWTELESGAKNTGEVSIGGGICVNTICNGLENFVYVGGSDGMIRKIRFSSDAA